MKIRITSELPVLINDICGIIGYLNNGEEYEVFSTNDGLKFKALGQLISPYDIIGFCELIE